MLSSYFYRLTLHILYIHHALPLALRAEHNEVFRLGVRSDFRPGFSAADGAEYPFFCHNINPFSFFGLRKQLLLTKATAEKIIKVQSL